MRTLILSAFFALVWNMTCFGQDRIVTVTSDTFECKITKVDTRYIHFDYKVRESIRSTLISLDKVASYEKGVYPTTSRPQNQSKKQVESDKSQSDAPKWSSNYNNDSALETEEGEKKIWRPVRLAFNVGFSHMIAKGTDGLSSDLKAYEDALRSGWHWGAAFDYYIANKDLSVGLKFHRMNTSNSGEFVFPVTLSNGTVDLIQIRLEDNIRMTHVGPHFTYRSVLSETGSNFILGSSIGYLQYINDGMVGDPVYIEGSGVAVMLELNFDIAISEGVKFNIGSSLLVNSMTNLKVNGTGVSLTSQDALNNSHLNAYFGLVFDID